MILLGFLFILVGALYPGQDAGWNSLRKTISTGPTFPSFDNPFARNFLFTQQEPNASVGTFTSVTGCPTNAFWKCVSTNDGNKSYVTLHDAFQIFDFNLTNLQPAGIEVTGVVVNIWCRGNQTTEFKVFVGLSLTDQTYAFNCPVFSDRLNASFSQVSFGLRPVCTAALPPNTYCSWFSQNFNRTSISIRSQPQGTNPKGFTDFTYIRFDIYSNRQTPCTGSSFDAFGCQISRLFIGIVNGILYVVNGIVFVAGIIAALLVFIGGIISGFLLGTLTAMGWFLAVPGAPDIVQKIFAAAFLGGMGFLLFKIVQTVRGQNP